MGPEATISKHAHQCHAIVTYRQDAVRDRLWPVAEATHQPSLTPGTDASSWRLCVGYTRALAVSTREDDIASSC